jgi:hypothetical protein
VTLKWERITGRQPGPFDARAVVLVYGSTYTLTLTFARIELAKNVVVLDSSGSLEVKKGRVSEISHMAGLLTATALLPHLRLLLRHP